MNNILISLKKYNQEVEKELIGREIIVPQIADHNDFKGNYLMDLLMFNASQDLQKDVFDTTQTVKMDKDFNYQDRISRLVRSIDEVNRSLNKYQKTEK